MMDSRRLAYLDAMGIDVWQSRGVASISEPAVVEPGIEIGAGDGDILCIVQTKAEAELKLAAGIGAAMRCKPVWAWPAGKQDQPDGSLTIEAAVSEKMLTRILVFGEDLAETLLGSDNSEVVSTARVHLVPTLANIAKDKDAKRSLWRLMNEHGIAANRSGGR